MRRSLFVFVLPGLLLGLLLTPKAALAQPPVLEDPSPPSKDLEALRAELGQSFRLLPLKQGIALTPLARDAEFGLLEVSEGLAVDGAAIEADALRELLGGTAADAVLALAELSPEDRGRVANGNTSPPEASSPPVAPPSPAPPLRPSASTERDRGRSWTSSGDRTLIRKGQTVEQAVTYGEELIIEGEVEGDAIAYGDDVEVSGRVHGTVTAVSGDVYLKDGAVVDGDAVSVGGKVERDSGAVLRGEAHEVRFNFWDWPDRWWDPGRGWGSWRWPRAPVFEHPFGSFLSFLWNLISGVLHMVLLAILCSFIVLVAPRRVELAATQVRREPWKAGFIGLAAFLLFWTFVFLVTLLLVASCIGAVLLPLVALLIVAFVGICLVGYTAAAYRLGHLIQSRFNLGIGNPYVLTLIGMFAIQIWAVLAGLLDWGGWILLPFALLLLFFGFLVELWAWMVGLGGFLMSGNGRGGAPGIGTPVSPIPPVSPSDPGPPDPEMPTEPSPGAESSADGSPEDTLKAATPTAEAAPQGQR